MYYEIMKRTKKMRNVRGAPMPVYELVDVYDSKARANKRISDKPSDYVIVWYPAAHNKGV